MASFRLRASVAAIVGAILAGPAVAEEGRYLLPPGVGACPSPTAPCAPCAPCPPPCDPCAWTGCDARRGPIEIRDEYVLAQPRLTLPAIGPDTLGCGRTTLRGFLHWSNSFGFDQDLTGEDPPDRRFIVDGEARTFEVTATHGVARDVDVGFRIPVQWRGAGIMDAIIDEFHALTEPIGFLDNDRPEFDQDRFRVHGRNEDGSTFDWDDEKGTGLGRVEVSGKWRFVDGCRDGWSVAALLRVALPTATEPFDGTGFGFGGQLVVAKRLAPRFDLFLGVGGTAETDDEIDGVHYETFRGHVFAALEWRPASTWSLVLETDYATGLTTDIVSFESQHWYVHLDAKIDLGRRWQAEIGFTENIVDQQATADFGVHFGLMVRL